MTLPLSLSLDKESKPLHGVPGGDGRHRVGFGGGGGDVPDDLCRYGVVLKAIIAAAAVRESFWFDQDPFLPFFAFTPQYAVYDDGALI
jgi:hypothetical protein